MPQGLDDAVRSYQLPTNAPGQLYLSQYNLAANTPIYITPGFGGSSSPQLPPIHSWGSHYDFTMTFYCEAAASEEGQDGDSSEGDTREGEPNRHVKRVFKSEAGGGGDTPSLRAGEIGGGGNEEELDPDVYVDVLRVDWLPALFASYDQSHGKAGQEIHFRIRWNDDPQNPEDGVSAENADIQGENANDSRKTYKRHIKDPENPDDEEIKLWIIKKAHLSARGDEFGGQGEFGVTGQAVTFVFNNSGDDQAHREVTTVEVNYNDLGESANDPLKMSEDDGSFPVLVPWAEYKQHLKIGEIDEDQFLDVEVTDLWWGRYASQERGTTGQKIQFCLDSEEIELLFKLGDPQAVDANGDDSVIRTDPLQTVVNVSFGNLAVIFGVTDQDCPIDPPWGKQPRVA